MKKSVLVTGAHDGTGFAIASRFAAEGYSVFVGSREKSKAESAAERLKEQYGVFAKGYSYQTLIEKFNMKPVGAFLTLDWIIREPEIAIENLNRGIK